MVERLPPSTALINSIRAERSSYHSWAGEAIDNSLDAEARNVWLRVNDQCLEVEDNGHGIKKECASAIVQISNHVEMPGTKLGRYGVGIKFKAVQHGNRLDVVSVSADGKLRRQVDWKELLKIGEWDYPDPKWSDVPKGSLTGTKIRISDLIGKPPRTSDIEKIYKEVQRRYYPAIEDGVVINLNDSRVEALPMPLLTHPVVATLSFPDGRKAHIRGGILVDQTSKLREVDLCVAFRVIKPESDFGCNGYGGIRSMYARINLTGPWKLTRFKEDIADDPYEDDLAAAVEDVLRPILEKCQSQSMEARHSELETLLNEMIPEGSRLTRPEGKDLQGRQGKKSKDKQEKTVNGKPSKTGPTRGNSRAFGFKIEFAEHLCAAFGYGRAEISKRTVRVQLSLDCRDIADLAAYRDRGMAARSLYGYATLLLESERAKGLLDIDGPLGLRAWKIGQQQQVAAE